jgi:hypothetical protein
VTFTKKTTPRQRSYPTAIPLAQRRNAVFARMDVPAAPPIDKENAPQHQGYMDLVRALPCAHCGKAPRSQFCHSDEGKGMGIKSDCRLGWPGCPECHDAIGTHRIYPRHQRRALEAEMARQTRAQIESMGLWPKDMEKWDK